MECFGFVDQQNQGAALITVGRYEDAIVSLTHTLSVTKAHMDWLDGISFEEVSFDMSSSSDNEDLVPQASASQCHADESVAAASTPMEAAKNANEAEPSFHSMDVEVGESSSCEAMPDFHGNLDVYMSARPGCPQKVGGRDQQELFLYEHPIYLPLSFSMASKRHEYLSTLMVSVTTMFNLALAYHMYGLQQPNKTPGRQEALCKAARLYELVYELFHDEEQFESILFPLACLSNLGIIHHCVGRSDTSQRCFDHVLRYVMYWQDQHQYRYDIIDVDDGDSSLQSRRIINGEVVPQFLSNAFSHGGSTTTRCTAAAAA